MTSDGALIARDTELAALEAWVADPWAGLALIEGEAGIGKTSLWRHACALAAEKGYAVSSSTPAEAERQLVFAGLADLLGPILPNALTALAPARRAAIEAALLLGEPQSHPADERAVAFAALDVLRSAARERPLVLAIDDAQWLDRSSAAVIAFALRRLTRADRIAALVARRTSVEDDASRSLVEAVAADQRSVTSIGPLSLGAVHRLYRERLGLSFPRPQIVKIHETCGGNPFFALEIGRALATEPAGRGDLPIPASLAEAVGARLSELSPTARRLALLAAAAAQPTLKLLALAAPDADLDAATAEGVAAGVFVAGTDPLRFEHPLLAAASYALATETDRRAAHLDLAAVVDATEQRGRHLAIARATPDADTAAALDAAADAAELRGAQATSGELREWAAEMTPATDADGRAGRLVAAGYAAFLSGDTVRSRSLFESVGALPGLRQHEALWRLGILLDETAGWDAARGPWLQAAETDDLELRVHVQRNIAVTAAYVEGLEMAAMHSAEAVEAAELLGNPHVLAYALATDAFVRTLAGSDGADEELERAMKLAPEMDMPELEWTPAAVTAERARLLLRLEEARTGFERLSRIAGARGNAPIELWSAYGSGQVAVDVGDLELAGALSTAVDELAEQTGLMALPALRLRARIAAHTGDGARCRELSERGLAQSSAGGEGLHQFHILTVLGALALSEGSADEAAETFGRCRSLALQLQIGAPGLLRFEVDHAEALVSLGSLDQAEEALAGFEQLALDCPWARPLVDRGRALIASARGDHAEAERLLSAAATAESLPLPLERARIDLCLGRVLRRQKRRAESREVLDRAVASLDALGSRVWADQARAERARIGGRSRAAGLTATEAQVASLVAAGKTNKATAAALFVTPSTVEAHLSRIYAKLGIRSRNELRAALAEQTVGVSSLSAEEPRP